MDIKTTRFGMLSIEPSDIITFPAGLLGLEACRQWVLLADAQNEALGWLQCTSRTDVALAVVSPRRFVSDYQVRLAKCELSPLALENLSDAKVLSIVGKNDATITLNLKAPLVINLRQRLGRQVISSSDYSVQYALQQETQPLKRTA